MDTYRKSVGSRFIDKFKKQQFKFLKRKYYKFNLIFLGAVLVFVFGISCFNITIDPYGIFSSPTWIGINVAKPQKFEHDMLIHAIEISHVRPQIIFLGSSRVQWGLNPVHPYFSGEKVYNLGLQGVNMYQTRRYFEHALSNQPELKRVILGIDELMFSDYVKNRPDFDENRLEKHTITLKDAINVIFSEDAFNASKETLFVNHTKPANLTVGSFKVKPPVFINGLLALDPRVLTPGSIEAFEDNFRGRLNLNRQDDRYSKYQISDEQLENFRLLVNICKQKNIDLQVFISPEHALLFEVMNQVRFGAEIEQWKRALVSIHPIWDFSGYNSITTESIRGNMAYYLDSSHYSPATGTLILNRVLFYQLERVPNDFGVLMTPETIDAHLDQVDRDRQVWASHNPDLVKLARDTGRPV